MSKKLFNSEHDDTTSSSSCDGITNIYANDDADFQQFGQFAIDPSWAEHNNRENRNSYDEYELKSRYLDSYRPELGNQVTLTLKATVNF